MIRISPGGLGMPAFEYRQAEEIKDAFQMYGVLYLFIDKSGAILLGFPDTTQDADIYVKKDSENGRALVDALKDIGFTLTDEQAAEIIRGKDFVQLKNGPFDLDLVFAPDGIERFEDAYRRRVDVEGFPRVLDPEARVHVLKYSGRIWPEAAGRGKPGFSNPLISA